MSFGGSPCLLPGWSPGRSVWKMRQDVAVNVREPSSVWVRAADSAQRVLGAGGSPLPGRLASWRVPAKHDQPLASFPLPGSSSPGGLGGVTVGARCGGSEAGLRRSFLLRPLKEVGVEEHCDLVGLGHAVNILSLW